MLALLFSDIGRTKKTSLNSAMHRQFFYPKLNQLYHCLIILLTHYGYITDIWSELGNAINTCNTDKVFICKVVGDIFTQILVNFSIQTNRTQQPSTLFHTLACRTSDARQVAKHPNYLQQSVLDPCHSSQQRSMTVHLHMM